MEELTREKNKYNKEVERKYFLKGTEKILKARMKVHRKSLSLHSSMQEEGTTILKNGEKTEVPRPFVFVSYCCYNYHTLSDLKQNKYIVLVLEVRGLKRVGRTAFLLGVPGRDPFPCFPGF